MSGRSPVLAVVLVVALAAASHERIDAQELRPSTWSDQWPLTEGQGVCLGYSGWCPINGALTIGASCVCSIPPGGVRIYGTVTDHWYRGRVNPYFNFHTPPVPVPATTR